MRTAPALLCSNHGNFRKAWYIRIEFDGDVERKDVLDGALGSRCLNLQLFTWLILINLPTGLRLRAL